MDTLIELYDDRPIENVLAAEVFRPARTVFLCPEEIARSRQAQQVIRDFFSRRNIPTECVFLETSLLRADKVERQLQKVLDAYPDCALDITGGSDAALFACGHLCGTSEMPVFTYSRKRGMFFSIRNANFANGLQPGTRYGIDDIFLMAGGRSAEGRVDNSVLARYKDFIPLFFAVYREHRREWLRTVDYIQRSSRSNETLPSLQVETFRRIKGERGTLLECPDEVMRDLERIGAIRDLVLGEKNVSFDFRDRQIRAWLRDVGSVLELYIYALCAASGLFQEVRTSVVVRWENSDSLTDAVTNEIDIMAVRGIMPVFISCKTCAIETYALNELAILRDRFGGPVSRAVIVTTQPCRAVTRHRAEDLGITVIDWEDIRSGDTEAILASVCQ